MPELPEVETVVRDLRPLLVGQRLIHVHVGPNKLRRGWNNTWTDQIRGTAVNAIHRRGKWIVVDLASGTRLVVHLGMTGQLTISPRAEPVADHTHVVVDLSGGASQLRFRDVRRFGSLELFPDETAVQQFFASRLGPEPDELTSQEFRQAVQKSQRTLKGILLDQKVLAGVGNIYADESLHRARLHPERRGSTLTEKECDRLRIAIRGVIAQAIEHRGSTIRDYIGGSGLKGGFQHRFRVYGRTGEPCSRCSTPIEVVRVAGRSSHYCPQCQALSGSVPG